MPERVAGLPVDPLGAAGAAVPGGRELPAVAALAVDVVVLAVVDGVELELLGAGGAGGALHVVALAVRVHLLGLEDGAAAPRAVGLLVLALDDGRVDQLVVDVGRPCLRAVRLVVALLAVQAAV